ncbi:hypothetical protein FPQ18DRAFT_310048 [Pyronema domesticum]|uniref:Uncharacterized protein n=1 Tax=Pyronema omphalodes (strain CBS 100304) TaxID=1076935 RepID=U4LSE3_PYROM|nr:hypothetical protein FPQ18DRAFT_310048 [Pyronema domesticum]CCX30221.1 Protein of unknown function [Pyronema omphalodes CBS 100304]
MRSYLNPQDDLWADGVGPYSRNNPNVVDAPIELLPAPQAAVGQLPPNVHPDDPFRDPQPALPARAHLPPNIHPNDPFRDPEPVLPVQNAGNAIVVRRPWYRWRWRHLSKAQKMDTIILVLLIITLALILFALFWNKSLGLSGAKEQRCKQIWIDGGWSRMKELVDAECVKIDWRFRH